MSPAPPVFTRTLLKAAAVLCEGTFTDAAADDPMFISLIAGRGEVQVIANGEAYFLTRDRAHAVSECVELSPPPGSEARPGILATWMLDQAARFEGR
jgi:hypothetical protein